MTSLRRTLLCLTLVLASASPLWGQSSTFGNSVVIGEDEIIVAEPNNNFRPGTVYVYRRSGGQWREAQQLRAPDAERADGFGALVASSGNDLFVAGRGGDLHTFRRSGSEWRHTGTLAASVEGLDPDCNQYGYCGNDFGIALAATQDWLLVGEARTPAGPRRRPEGEDAVAGRRAGEPDPTAGVVHVFRRSGGGWQPAGQLRPSASTAGDRFGAAVAVVGDRALIGAPGLAAGNPPEPQRRRRGDEAAPAPQEIPLVAGAGRVFDFRLRNGQWTEVAPVAARADANAALGSAIAVDGDLAVVGAPGHSEGHGAAYLLRWDDAAGVWNEAGRLAPFRSDRGDRFGSSVGIEGGDVWVGAPTPQPLAYGSVYVYGPGPDGEPAATARRIRLDDTNREDLFGDRVHLEGDVAAVSATGRHHGAGEVVLYERSGGDWRQTARLISPPDALAAMTGAERECLDGKIGPFDCKDVELLSFVSTSILRAPGDSRGVRTNDNWGWTDPQTGREYALVGRNDGTSFIDITDPANPVLVGDLPATEGTPRSQLWRDIKTYENHAFIVADGAGEHGMQVFDLTRLRDVRDPPALFEEDALYRGSGSNRVASSHNIAINEETGFAYLVGGGCGGIHMVDITEPTNPRFAGCTDPGGTHDMQCLNYQGPDADYRGKEVCLRSAADDFIISDVTDKDNPRQLATVSHPNPAYLHQGWVTEDQKYFIMDDESDVIRGLVPTTRTLIWDISDLEDPRLAEEFMGSLPASAHNLYVKGDRAYQANYRYGLHVLDVSDPLNPREVGMFDTSPYHDGPGFSGAWSTYPFFDSGTVIVTSLQEGLFVLKPRDGTVF